MRKAAGIWSVKVLWITSAVPCINVQLNTLENSYIYILLLSNSKHCLFFLKNSSFMFISMTTHPFLAQMFLGIFICLKCHKRMKRNWGYIWRLSCPSFKTSNLPGWSNEGCLWSCRCPICWGYPCRFASGLQILMPRWKKKKIRKKTLIETFPVGDHWTELFSASVLRFLSLLLLPLFCMYIIRWISWI